MNYCILAICVFVLISVKGSTLEVAYNNAGPTAQRSHVPTRAVQSGNAVETLQQLNNEGHPGLYVAIRQPLLDYGTTVGLDILEKHIRALVVPPVAATVHLPVVGDVDVAVANLHCSALSVPRDLAAITVRKRDFHIEASDVSAEFSFHWQWSSQKAGFLHGSGDGKAHFRGGAIAAAFEVHDEGRLMLDLDQPATSIAFADISLSVSNAALTPLYDALLALFHSQVADAISKEMNAVLTGRVPKEVNALLSDVPEVVPISGLPFTAAFRYAVYTDSFVMVSGFPQIAQKPTPTPTPSSPLAALTDLLSTLLHSTHSPAILPTEDCPMVARELNISDTDILKDGHMATAYLHDSVIQCILWALHERGALKVRVQDGDLPGIRLITDLLPYLLPGVQVDYPHHPVAFSVAATALPHVHFAEGRGVMLNASFAIRVDVLPLKTDATNAQSARRSGSSGALPLEVALLVTDLSLTADVQYGRTWISDLQIKCSVVKSVYDVNPVHWERTLQFVLTQAQAQWGLLAIYDELTPGSVAGALLPVNVSVEFLDGWYAVSSDVEVTEKNLTAVHAS